MERKAPGYDALVRLCDLAILAGGLFAIGLGLGMAWRWSYALAAACAAVLYVLAAEARGVYRSWRAGGLGQEASQVLLAWATAAVALAGLAYIAGSAGAFPRRLFLLWGVVTPVALVAARLPIRQLARWLRASGRNQRRAAIAGAGPLGLRIAQTILAEPWMGLRLEGLYDDRRPAAERHRAAGIPLLGGLGDLAERARQGELDVVYLALPSRAAARLKGLVRELAQTRADVYFVPDLADLALLRTRWFTFGAIPTVSVFENPLRDLEWLLKRAEDLALSLVILLVAAIPMLLIALGVKLTSRGPVIFRQRRHGLDGREIVVWKFRTMEVCEHDRSFRQATRGDPRVTRFGAFLRSTSLDELPQFLNVLQGRMSIVGPRPHPLPLDEAHRELVDWYALRGRVKPGITGWAQINGYRGETDTVDKMRRRIEHDLQYINQWSLWLDLKIIALTVMRGWVDRNAY